MVLHGYLAFITLAFRPALLLGLRIALLLAVRLVAPLLLLSAAALAGSMTLALCAVIPPCAITVTAISTTVTLVIGLPGLALLIRGNLKRFNYTDA
jgi:hypothetical protein